MRIISQDGRIDVPYEMVALHECAGKIRMNMAGDTGRGTILAVYSTEAKVQKAMEMLHNEYHGYKVEEVYHDGAEGYHPIFKFPADEEVQDEKENMDG